jgi:hypothetical protein
MIFSRHNLFSSLRNCLQRYSNFENFAVLWQKNFEEIMSHTKKLQKNTSFQSFFVLLQLQSAASHREQEFFSYDY